MSETWTALDKIGVSMYKYIAQEKYQLALSFGTIVEITSQHRGWYYGKSFESNKLGIFPSNYIKIFEGELPEKKELEKSEFHPLIEADPTTKELDTSLIEYHYLIKTRSIPNFAFQFRFFWQQIENLLKIRKIFMTKGQPKQVYEGYRKNILAIIDLTNNRLKKTQLRDSNSNKLIDERTVPILELHDLYVNTTSEGMNTSNSSKKFTSTVNFQFEFKQITTALEEELELHFFLYQKESKTVLSEEFVIFLGKDKKPILEKTKKLSALFIDIGSEEQHSLYLVCRVIRIGSLIFQSKKDSNKMYRRPYSSGVEQLANQGFMLIGEEISTKELKTFIPSSENTFINLHDLLLDDNYKIDLDSSTKINVSLRVISDSLDKLLSKGKNNNSVDISNNLLIPKLSLPKIVLPTYHRDDLYLELHKGDFPSMKAKNVQLIISVIKINVMNKYRCIVVPESKDPVNEYKTVVYYHRTDPAWNEIVKLTFSEEMYKTCEIYFELKSCTHDKNNDKVFCFGFLKLWENDNIIGQENRKIKLYKLRKKKDKEIIAPNGDFKDTKNSIELSVRVCSTIQTQNKILNKILKLRKLVNNSTNIKQEELEPYVFILQQLKTIPTIIINYLDKILDSLFYALVLGSNTLSLAAYQAMASVWGSIIENKDLNYQVLIQAYLQHRFTLSENNEERDDKMSNIIASSYQFLIDHLMYILEIVIKENENEKEMCTKNLSALYLFMTFIIHSKLLDDAIMLENINEKSEKSEKSKKSEKSENRKNKNKKFGKDLNKLWEQLSQLMEKTAPVWIVSIQEAALKNYYQSYLELPKVISINEVARVIGESLRSVARGRKALDEEKMNILINISTGPLFKAKTSRLQIVELVINEVRKSYTLGEIELNKCTKIIANLLFAIKNNENLEKDYPQLYQKFLNSDWDYLSKIITKNNNINNNEKDDDEDDLDEEKNKNNNMENNNKWIYELVNLPEILIQMFNHNKEKLSDSNFKSENDESLNQNNLENDSQFNSSPKFAEEISRNEQLFINKLQNPLIRDLSTFGDSNEKLISGKTGEHEMSFRRKIGSRIVSVLLTLLDLLDEKTFWSFFKKRTWSRQSKRERLTLLFRLFCSLLDKETYSIDWTTLIWIKFTVIFKVLTFAEPILINNFLNKNNKNKQNENENEIEMEIEKEKEIQIEIENEDKKEIENEKELDKFSPKIWKAYFKALIYFIGNNFLQQEEEENKARFTQLYFNFGDLRLICCRLLRKTWPLLKEKHHHFIKSCADNSLSFLLLRNQTLADLGFSLYYSLLIAEYQKTENFELVTQGAIQVIDKAMRNQLSEKFQGYFFEKILDNFDILNVKHTLITSGKGLGFLAEIKTILDLILALRHYPPILKYEEERTQILLELFEQLRRNKQFKMLIRYYHTLFDLNIILKNYEEAANTLCLYADMLDLSKNEHYEIEELTYPRETTASRKERVLKRAIFYYQEGGAYEKAIELIKILEQYHEKITFDYPSLVDLGDWKMKLLQFIVQKTRVFPTYYRVGYFGKGFENSDKKNSIGKLFIYKGQLLEQLTTFVQNLKNKYPKSTIHGAEPTEEQKKWE
ncbi:myoblast city [Anaeramoeba flamelloides]|uniref:Myoblast city n=1 Tax=Anaeramoeba flamelloides TaxID=1746091 RepID=A0ABQ8XSK1_9EUKA|nr:myoblast city [Anaeramoeba flamelloides]